MGGSGKGRSCAFNGRIRESGPSVSIFFCPFPFLPFSSFSVKNFLHHLSLSHTHANTPKHTRTHTLTLSLYLSSFFPFSLGRGCDCRGRAGQSFPFAPIPLLASLFRSPLFLLIFLSLILLSLYNFSCPESLTDQSFVASPRLRTSPRR